MATVPSMKILVVDQPVSRAARDVLVERQRQIDAEGWTPEHDDAHGSDDLALAGACYAAGVPIFTTRRRVGARGEPYMGFADAWPFDESWWKPKDRRRDLVRAAALILAEIDRLDRSAPVQPETQGV